jgi:hypothetical protein
LGGRIGSSVFVAEAITPAPNRPPGSHLRLVGVATSSAPLFRVRESQRPPANRTEGWSAPSFGRTVEKVRGPSTRTRHTVR